MLEPKFALVEEEDGFKDAAPGIRPRALMFFTDGGSVIRTFAGRWVGEDRIPFDVIMPEDLREFRKASDMELSDLFQDFSATPGVVPIRSKAATKASL